MTFFPRLAGTFEVGRGGEGGAEVRIRERVSGGRGEGEEKGKKAGGKIVLTRWPLKTN